MVDLGGEAALWWSEWIVSWEVDVQEEHSSSIWTVFRSDDGGLPMEQVLLVAWSS